MKIPVWMLRVRFMWGRLRYRLAHKKWPCAKCSRPDLCRIVVGDACLRPQLPGDVMRAVRAVEKWNAPPPALSLYGEGKRVTSHNGVDYVMRNVVPRSNGGVDMTLQRLYPKRPAGISARQWDRMQKAERRKRKGRSGPKPITLPDSAHNTHLALMDGQSTPPRVSDYLTNTEADER